MKFDNILATICRFPMTTPILSERTNFALSDEAHIRPVGRDSDDDYVSRYRATWDDRG